MYGSKAVKKVIKKDNNKNVKTNGNTGNNTNVHTPKRKKDIDVEKKNEIDVDKHERENFENAREDNSKTNEILDATSRLFQSAQKTVTHGGTVSSEIAIYGSPTPFVVITRPKVSKPSKYSHWKGYPSNVTKKLGDTVGFQIVDKIYLTSSATENEKNKIMSYLMNGVYIKK